MSVLFPPSKQLPGEIERALARSGIVGAAGVDEAGRGALCGPVVAAAVVLGREPPAGLDDSKRLSPGTRVRLAAEIRQMARGWGLGSATAAEIDEVNILNATFLAMRRALASLQEGLGSAPGLVLVDGPLAIRGLDLLQKPVVKGDQRSLNIAAASILAKVERDLLMTALEARYPGYGLAENKGYGTAEHRRALRALGPTPDHRRSFRTG